MSDYLIQSETLTSIANAIRGKAGVTGEIAVPDMPGLIEQLNISDASSTLPPPTGFVAATGGNQMVTVSFEAVASEYEQYLGDTAYIVVLKEGSVPESPTDGTVIKMDKTGAVIE